ncbi:LysR family transcriptional regulator [Escherichia coli]|nr:LysR family transcriptional regulator [Escherichia coli]
MINRTLTRHSELSFSTFFVSSMSELLKQVALDGCGIAWLPEYAIQQEIRSGQLVVLNRDELVIPIQDLRIPDEYSHESRCRTLLA